MPRDCPLCFGDCRGLNRRGGSPETRRLDLGGEGGPAGRPTQPSQLSSNVKPTDVGLRCSPYFGS